MESISPGLALEAGEVSAVRRTGSLMVPVVMEMLSSVESHRGLLNDQASPINRRLRGPRMDEQAPAMFVLGLFTIVRLVESALESMQYLTGIARIRGYYRTLGPEAARHFAPEYGRWPEVEPPALANVWKVLKVRSKTDEAPGRDSATSNSPGECQ